MKKFRDCAKTLSKPPAQYTSDPNNEWVASVASTFAAIANADCFDNNDRERLECYTAKTPKTLTS